MLIMKSIMFVLVLGIRICYMYIYVHSYFQQELLEWVAPLMPRERSFNQETKLLATVWLLEWIAPLMPRERSVNQETKLLATV